MTGVQTCALPISWRRISLDHVAASVMSRPTLAAVHLGQDEGVAALSVLHTVELLPPLSWPSLLAAPASRSHWANHCQQQRQPPLETAQPHGYERRQTKKGHLQLKDRCQLALNRSLGQKDGTHGFTDARADAPCLLFLCPSPSFGVCGSLSAAEEVIFLSRVLFPLNSLWPPVLREEPG